MADDEPPRGATLPTSTNRELDADIQAKELIAIELEAPWALRIYATVASSLRKWLGAK
jgi:hypothetical protein